MELLELALLAVRLERAEQQEARAGREASRPMRVSMRGSRMRQAVRQAVRTRLASLALPM